MCFLIAKTSFLISTRKKPSSSGFSYILDIRPNCKLSVKKSKNSDLIMCGYKREKNVVVLLNDNRLKIDKKIILKLSSFSRFRCDQNDFDLGNRFDRFMFRK